MIALAPASSVSFISRLPEAARELVAGIREHHEVVVSIHARASVEEQNRAPGHARQAGLLIPAVTDVYNERRRREPALPCWTEGTKSVLGFTYQTAWTYERIALNWEELDAALEGSERSIRGAGRYLRRTAPVEKKPKLKPVPFDKGKLVHVLRGQGLSAVADNLGRVLAAFNLAAEQQESPYRLCFDLAAEAVVEPGHGL